MIQRIQTVYLLITIICLSIVTFGVSIFRFETENGSTILSSFGLQEFDKANKSIEISSYPYFIAPSILILLCVLTIVSYKNLKNQIKLIRVIFMLYFILTVALIYFAFMTDLAKVSAPKLDLGFYLFSAGLPFVFLANLGIKKDKNLLDSLNRLR
ncbi:MAG: DUF4293 domain-containing protein [Bacteroidota bacterium]